MQSGRAANSYLKSLFGIDTPMKTTYNSPGLVLDYTASGALDRFGRIIDHAWEKGATDIVRIQHGYDRVGNRMYRKDMVSTTNSELYSYDGVNQIKSLNRGTLNSSNDGITGSTFTESWNFDGTGNWLQYNRAGSAIENRTHNAANEVQTTCTHDRNGNMTVMPGLQGKYDAWNRLVEVRNASNVLLATYAYNGLNHRVRKTVSNVVTTSFFNRDWQELESTTSSTTSVYVWGLRYIDDIVYRDKGAERLYSLADPNWNVVALTNASGTVQERMRYDGFGKITWLNTSFASKGSSGYDWNRTFTGQVLDSETGLMLYRMRYYHTGLGRFVQRDPIGYQAGDASLYRYVRNMPIILDDPAGLQSRVSPMPPSPCVPCNCDCPDCTNPFPPDSESDPEQSPNCCDGKPCCGGKPYDPETQCCEENQIVAKVSIWICNRPFPWRGAGYLQGYNFGTNRSLDHSYVCCDGVNQNCFGKQNYTRKNSPIPNEPHNVQGECEEKKVCPELKQSKCGIPGKTVPISQRDYHLVNSNCHHWAWEGVER